jgi:catechol 2,3-dioxygenase-like lactoylglutathione lyase family enzyme
VTPLRLLETCLCVDDLDSAANFYGGVLGLEAHAREEGRHLFFRCGEGMLLLFIAEATQDPSGGLPPHGATGSGHAAFAVPLAELDAWEQRLQSHGVAIEQEVHWPNGARSLYFRDPAGNSLELASEGLWKSGE